MKLLTPLQMREIDEKATSRYHIPSLLLMEHAAYGVFTSIKEHDEGKDVIIICGPGNNGGDGLALARQLMSWSDCKLKVIMAASPSKLTEDGKTYYQICKEAKVDLIELNAMNKERILSEIEEAELIVDALFGIGLSRPVEGLFKEVVCAINHSSGKIISVDIPSGIDGLTGKVQGIAVHADRTVTFMAAKLGLCLYPAILYTGELEVVDIGIPKVLINEMDVNTYSLEQEEMKAILPKRTVRSNKGSYGKVLTVGGKLGMAGAISLTSMAAYKVGCGTVTALVPRSIIEIIQYKLTEVMAVGADEVNGHFGMQASKELSEMISRYDIVAIGPGCGRSEEIKSLLMTVIESDKPCVIDADALYFVPEVAEQLASRKAPTILTPHPGEMARLTGKTIEEILDHPLEVSLEAARKFNAIIVLKIEKTVIADANGHIYINRYGNSGLAKGGSGDALTGIITGLLAQHLNAVDAAKLGVHIQTRAADIAKMELSEYSFVASDTISFISKVFLELLER